MHPLESRSTGPLFLELGGVNLDPDNRLTNIDNIVANFLIDQKVSFQPFSDSELIGRIEQLAAIDRTSPINAFAQARSLNAQIGIRVSELEYPESPQYDPFVTAFRLISSAMTAEILADTRHSVLKFVRDQDNPEKIFAVYFNDESLNCAFILTPTEAGALTSSKDPNIDLTYAEINALDWAKAFKIVLDRQDRIIRPTPGLNAQAVISASEYLVSPKRR